MEKETLGTYLSSHPLAEVARRLRARVDCSLAELAGKPDGAWVTVGGIVVECKKIRTKSGSQMMFATLDDVEGQVEMLVFKADQAESAAVIAPDAIVLVRGRLDHKDRGETKLVVQEAERFEPDSEEIASGSKAAAPARAVRADDRRRPLSSAGLIEELKSVFEHHKGEAEVHLVMRPARAPKSLRFGDDYRVRPSSGLRAEIDHFLGPTRWPLESSKPLGSAVSASLDFSHDRNAHRDRRVPPVPLLLRQDGRAARLRRTRLPLPLQLRRPAHGEQYVGCMQEVFGAEIDLAAVLEPGGFGGVKMTGEPLPHCQFSVERAYEGSRRVLRLRQPPLLRLHRRRPEGLRAFDLRDV